MTDPLKIIGVDVENTGNPRDDGTAGSALYAVPLKLSRRPTAYEAELLVHHWDHPSSFTTRHRFGIARVVGDTFVLDGTTVEEVRDHHVQTLRLVVDQTNTDALTHEQAQARERVANQAAAAEHKRTVRDVAGEIAF